MTHHKSSLEEPPWQREDRHHILCKGTPVHLGLDAQIRGVFQSREGWTCYRQNDLRIDCAITSSCSMYDHWVLLVDGHLFGVSALAICLDIVVDQIAHRSNRQTPPSLIQRCSSGRQNSPRTRLKKAEIWTKSKCGVGIHHFPLDAGPLMDHSCSTSDDRSMVEPLEHAFQRVQIDSATAKDRQGKSQEKFRVRATLQARVDGYANRWVDVMHNMGPGLIVRGKNPGYFESRHSSISHRLVTADQPVPSFGSAVTNIVKPDTLASSSPTLPFEGSDFGRNHQGDVWWSDFLGHPSGLDT